MFYGGVLIAATDADHDSYKRLGLLCPHCKDAVFLQAPSQRQTEGKPIDIPAHFKHFKAKDPALVKECENRVNKYDAKEIRRSAARARNQRLKLLQRRFWEVLTSYYEQKQDFPITKLVRSANVGQIAAMGHWMTNYFFKQPVSDLQATASQMIDGVYNDGHIFISWKPDKNRGAISPSSSIQIAFRESLSGKLDRQMQELIVGEILEFLHSRSSRPLVEQIFVLAASVLFDVMADGARLGLLGGDGPDLMVRTAGGVNIDLSFWQVPGNREIFYHYAVGHLCLWVSMLPWASELSEAG